jgi:hypothetical protein
MFLLFQPIMKTRSKSALVCCFALTTFPILADTLILKDGSKLEGRVLREEAGSYVVEVQVTKSIKDERTIPKADVASIKQEKPDEVAFEAISGLVPAPDALTQDEYAQRIRTVEKFLSDYRASAKSKEAKDMLATLKAEANEVLAGAVKLNGKIIPPSEYRANAYDIDARIEAAKIKRLVDGTRYLEALRSFSAFDRDFRNTAAYDELRPLVTKVIQTYLAGINQSLATFDARAKERQVGLERMSPADRPDTVRAIAEENAALEKRFKAEKDSKLGWVTTDPFYKPSLDETVSFGKQELTRLAAMGSAPKVDGGKLYRDAMALIQGGGNQAAVTAAITATKTALVSKPYLDKLEAAAKAAGLKP